MKRSAKGGARSSLHFQDEGALIHPPHQGEYLIGHLSYSQVPALAKRHKVEAKKDSGSAQEPLAKQVGTYDEPELCKLLLEISLLDWAYQRSTSSRDDVLMDAAKRYRVDTEKLQRKPKTGWMLSKRRIGPQLRAGRRLNPHRRKSRRRFSYLFPKGSTLYAIQAIFLLPIKLGAELMTLKR
jgi:hypothetical protein